METELKPCPFCGGNNIYQEHDHIICPDCGCIGPDKHITGEDVDPYAVWNKRYNSESKNFESLLTTAMEVIREADLLDEFAIKRGKAVLGA